MAASLSFAACHPVEPQAAGTASPGARQRTSSAEHEGRGSEPGEPGTTAPSHVPPPAPAPAPPRQRTCQELAIGARFCQEHREDWTRTLIRWMPGEKPGKPHLAPEEALLLARWLQRSLVEKVVQQSKSPPLLLAPESRMCDGAWLCFWVEPKAAPLALASTLEQWPQPQVGEFYLARLDAAAAWEDAARSALDPRAESAALLLDSARGARFAGRKSLSADDLSSAMGSSWIRRMGWEAAKARLHALFASSMLEVTGPLPAETRLQLEESVLSWKAQRGGTAPAAAFLAAPSSSPPKAKQAGLAKAEKRLVVVEDETARRARLVVILLDVEAVGERKELLERRLAALDLPAGVRLVQPTFPRSESGVGELVGTRQELETVLTRLWSTPGAAEDTDAAASSDAETAQADADGSKGGSRDEELGAAGSWLGVLWTPPAVDADSPEDGPQSP